MKRLILHVTVPESAQPTLVHAALSQAAGTGQGITLTILREATIRPQECMITEEFTSVDVDLVEVREVPGP
jgi:flagellar biosynthesis/type III secretory pathway protein FliH